MAEKGYQIGPVLADRIISVVRRSDDTPYRQGITKIPTRFEESFEDSGARVRIGRTTAVWSKGTLATIALHESGDLVSPTQTGTLDGCVNLFAEVAAYKWVAVAKASGGHYYLIAAECD